MNLREGVYTHPFYLEIPVFFLRALEYSRLLVPEYHYPVMKGANYLVGKNLQG
jgi:hypothetical protein